MNKSASFKNFSKFFLILDGIDALGISIIFGKFALFHMLDTSLPLGFTRMCAIRCNFRKLHLHWLLVNSWLSSLCYIWWVLSLQVLHCHHLAIRLRYKLIFVLVNYGSCSLLTDSLKSFLFIKFSFIDVFSYL